VRSPYRLRPVALAAALLATVLAACGGGSKPAAEAAAPAGGYQIGRMVQTFVDTRRPTPANGDAPGQPTRTLVTTLLYPATNGGPAAGGPFPLIVFGHGFTGSPAAYDPLLRTWVAAGYVVAAPAFPLSNHDAPGGPTQNDLPNQPGDVSFVITSVLALARAQGPLRGAIDPGRIAVAGHSMGASTTLGVFLNTCCRDERVAAAVVLSGNEIPMPNGRFAAPDPTPVLFVHGDADDVVPYAAGRRAFADAVAPKYFVTLPGADHLGPYSGAGDGAAGAVVRTTLDFFDRYLRGDAAGLARLRSDANVAGTASLEAIEK
jgi:dienelactone hydrolase